MNYTVEMPCGKDCPDRSQSCHGECERYAEFVKYNELRKKEKLNYLDTEYVLYCNREKRKEKRRKSSRK